MIGGIVSDVLRACGWVSRREYEAEMHRMEGITDRLRSERDDARGVLFQISHCFRDFQFSRDQQIRLPPNATPKSLIQELTRLNMANQHLEALMERAVLKDAKTGRFVTHEQKQQMLAAAHEIGEDI